MWPVIPAPYFQGVLQLQLSSGAAQAEFLRAFPQWPISCLLLGNSCRVKLTAGTSCKRGEDKIDALRSLVVRGKLSRCGNVYLLEHIIAAAVAFAAHVEGCKDPSALC